MGATNEQAALWSGVAGNAWVDAQDLIDRLFAPIENLLVDAVFAGPRGDVLDIGCGTGGITVALARALGPEARCVGVDISEPMITAATARAAQAKVAAEFLQADAEHHDFTPAGIDMIVSRFGVMFFDNPVRAFANLRRAARPGAAMHLIAWRGPEDNSFMTTAEQAAAPLLPNLPARDPDAPGQFAFADADRVHGYLTDGGWADVEVRPIDVPCAFPESALITYLTRFGPVGRVLPDVDGPTRTQVVDTVRAAFEPYVHDTEVRFTAACWSITAHA